MENLIFFTIACMLLIILPGPDTAIVTKNTIVSGQKGGFLTMVGSCVGLSVHTIATVAGLSAIIVQSAFAFTIIKYVGAAYLCYLGIKTLLNMRTKKVAIDDLSTIEVRGNSYFKQGLITNVTNPKVAVFFLTFLPQFLAEGSEPFWPFLTMGIIYIVLTFVWFAFYVFLLNKIRNFMKKPATQAVVEMLTGGVLIGFGLKLAFEKQ